MKLQNDELKDLLIDACVPFLMEKNGPAIILGTLMAVTGSFVQLCQEAFGINKLSLFTQAGYGKEAEASKKSRHEPEEFDVVTNHKTATS